jgi:hypothetical protein
MTQHMLGPQGRPPSRCQPPASRIGDSASPMEIGWYSLQPALFGAFRIARPASVSTMRVASRKAREATAPVDASGLTRLCYQSSYHSSAGSTLLTPGFMPAVICCRSRKERLMGFEPTTFCMASEVGGYGRLRLFGARGRVFTHAGPAFCWNDP